jgi:hypothetical protein
MINGIGIDTSDAAVRALVAERKKDPKYREEILNKLIEREMYLTASADLSNEDYRIRCEGGTPEQKGQKKSCLCSKIKKLFNEGY